MSVYKHFNDVLLAPATRRIDTEKCVFSSVIVCDINIRNIIASRDLNFRHAQL